MRDGAGEYGAGVASTPASGRTLPKPTPETAEYWAGTAVGQLRLPHCADCDRTYFPPQRLCPGCGGSDVSTVLAGGRGRVVSAVVSYLPAPGLIPPFVLAIVELLEGARMLTNIVGVAPDLSAIPPGLAVAVEFEPLGDELALPVFRPVNLGGESSPS